jgi:hypothetical protein
MPFAKFHILPNRHDHFVINQTAFNGDNFLKCFVEFIHFLVLGVKSFVSKRLKIFKRSNHACGGVPFRSVVQADSAGL